MIYSQERRKSSISVKYLFFFLDIAHIRTREFTQKKINSNDACIDEFLLLSRVLLISDYVQRALFADLITEKIISSHHWRLHDSEN